MTGEPELELSAGLTWVKVGRDFMSEAVLLALMTEDGRKGHVVSLTPDDARDVARHLENESRLCRRFTGGKTN